MQNKRRNYHFISSSERNNLNSSISDFRANGFALEGVNRFRVVNVIIPYTFYAVNDSNNTFYITDSVNSTKNAVTLTNGNYESSTTFATEIKTKLDALATSQVFTVTIPKLTDKMTITADSGTFTLNNSDNSTFANRLFGFSSTDSSDAITQTGANSINLGGPNFLCVYSRELTKTDTQIHRSGHPSHLFALVPTCNYDYRQTILYEPENLFFNYDQKTNPIIDLQLRFPTDELIDLNGHDWGITIEFISESNYRGNTRRA